MDIQTIVKQVIALAEQVIKNPSTKVSGSGFDLSSLTQMAGSLLGGNSAAGSILGSILGGGNKQQSSGAASGSGLGSILGGAIESGALGSILGGLAGGNQQQSQSASSPMGGALGSILGGLAGGNQQGASSSTGDLLGQLASKAGVIKDMLSGSKANDLSSDQKTNLTDVMNIINVAKGFLGGK